MGIGSLGSNAPGLGNVPSDTISQAIPPSSISGSSGQSSIEKLDDTAIEEVLALLPKPWIDQLY